MCEDVDGDDGDGCGRDVAQVCGHRSPNGEKDDDDVGDDDGDDDDDDTRR